MRVRNRFSFGLMGVLGAVAAGSVAWSAGWPLGLIGRSSPATSGPAAAGGSLLICGGGALPEEVRMRFLDLAGGPESARIVVIPTAHTAADSPEADAIYLKPWRDRGVRSVTLLHTRSKARADDPEFIRPLKDATGVWIGGGVQSALARAYGGTEVERELKQLIGAGGSSAAPRRARPS